MGNETETRDERQERFGKLIKHLECVDETCPESFDLCDWHNNVTDEVRDNLLEGKPLDCGFAGCVVGHMPLLFPAKFCWGLDEVEYWTGITGEDEGADEDSMGEFLGGTSEDWYHVLYEGNYLDEATLEAVLGRLRKLFTKLYTQWI